LKTKAVKLNQELNRRKTL